MTWWIWTLIGVYVVGFAFFFWIELMVGPVTPGLALFRAAVWPIFWATGWPRGTPMPMD
jgi:hypothetical protein